MEILERFESFIDTKFAPSLSPIEKESHADETDDLEEKLAPEEAPEEARQETPEEASAADPYDTSIPDVFKLKATSASFLRYAAFFLSVLFPSSYLS